MNVGELDEVLMNFGELDEVLPQAKKRSIEMGMATLPNNDSLKNQIITALLAKLDQPHIVDKTDLVLVVTEALEALPMDTSTPNQIAQHLLSSFYRQNCTSVTRSMAQRETRWNAEEELALLGMPTSTHIVQHWKDLCDQSTQYRSRSRAALLKKYRRIHSENSHK